MLTDTPLADAVLASLDLDPRIPDSLEIAVDADGGAVTLRGSVESFRQRRAAGEDARNVEGVYDVDNQLKVSLTGADRRDDDEIRGVAPAYEDVAGMYGVVGVTNEIRVTNP